MEARAIVVAVLFGALMGWGLGRTNPDARPIAGALAASVLGGAVLAATGSSLAGWSLVLGCGAGLATLAPRLWGQLRG